MVGPGKREIRNVGCGCVGAESVGAPEWPSERLRALS